MKIGIAIHASNQSYDVSASPFVTFHCSAADGCSVCI